MIDMHNHILFGIDDGARNISESMVLIKEEIRQGVHKIVFTPHFKDGVEFNREDILEKFQMLKDLVSLEGLNVELYLGSEVYFNSKFYDILDKKFFFTIAGSNYLLIEFSFLNFPENISEICYEIRLNGYVPIIAHAERYNNLCGNRKLLENVLKEGVLIQVNASSLVSKDICRFEHNHKFARYLLKNKLISIVASDAHNMTTRGIFLEEAYKNVEKKQGHEYAETVFKINQQGILNNEYIDVSTLGKNVKNPVADFVSKIFNKH
jgi:protein-tyrosine phosphatase